MMDCKKFIFWQYFRNFVSKKFQGQVSWYLPPMRSYFENHAAMSADPLIDYKFDCNLESEFFQNFTTWVPKFSHFTRIKASGNHFNDALAQGCKQDHLPNQIFYLQPHFCLSLAQTYAKRGKKIHAKAIAYSIRA